MPFSTMPTATTAMSPQMRAFLDELADEDLLWVDVDSSQRGAVERVTALLPVHLESMSVAAAHKPFIHDFGESFVIGVLPVPAGADRPESEMLICAVGHNWLVTVHDGDVGSASCVTAPTTT